MEELEIGTPINKYETVIIFDPTLTTEELTSKVNDYTNLIKVYSKPNKIACEEIGNKKLAYKLKRTLSRILCVILLVRYIR